MHFVCRKTRRFWREISKTQMRNVMSTDISQSLQDILRVTQRRFLSKRQDAGLALFAIRSRQIKLIISRIDKTNELLLGNYTQTKERFNTSDIVDALPYIEWVVVEVSSSWWTLSNKVRSNDECRYPSCQHPILQILTVFGIYDMHIYDAVLLIGVSGHGFIVRWYIQISVTITVSRPCCLELKASIIR